MRDKRDTKLIVVVACLLAALVAVPATASAAPELQTSAGAKVPVGESIKGASTNLVFTGSEPAGSKLCNGVLTGKVTENSGTSIKWNVETATFQGNVGPNGKDCETTFLIGGKPLYATVSVSNLPWCVYTEQSGNWDLTGKGCSSVASTTEANAPITFTTTLDEANGTVRGTCIYTTGSMLGGTYVTNSSPLRLKITNGGAFTKTGGTFPACPAKGAFSGEFTVTTATGAGLKAS